MAKPIVEIKDRLQEALDLRQMSQQELSDITDIPKSSISQYISGYAKPKDDRIHLISKALGVQEPWLLGYDVPIKYSDPTDGITNLIYPSAYRIPIIGRICAGDGCTVIEEKMGYFTIDHTIKADFALIVKGDSMIDIDINDGDVVLIKKAYDYFDGKIYAIRLIDEDEATIKKCFFEEDKVIMQPCNPEYKPMIADGKNVSVVGECVGVYHAL